MGEGLASVGQDACRRRKQSGDARCVRRRGAVASQLCSVLHPHSSQPDDEQTRFQAVVHGGNHDPSHHHNSGRKRSRRRQGSSRRHEGARPQLAASFWSSCVQTGFCVTLGRQPRKGRASSTGRSSNLHLLD